MNKRKIIYFLVVVVSALLFINVLLGLTKSAKKVSTEKKISIVQIEQNLFEVLNNFGLEKEWVEKRAVKKGLYDSLTHYYNLKIPMSVSIPVILKDLSEQFINQNVSIVSSEINTDGSTELTIRSENIIKLICKMQYSADLFVQYSQAAFLITDFESLDEFEKKKIYDISIPIGIILQLETGKQALASEIVKFNKRYFLELKSDVDDLEFELNNDLGLEELSKNINNIISNFNSPKIFFINTEESEFNLSTRNYIIDKFKDRGRSVKFTDKLIFLRGESLSDLHSLVKFHLNTLKAGESKAFRISSNDWIEVRDEVIKYQKKGNKIVSPTQVL